MTRPLSLLAAVATAALLSAPALAQTSLKLGILNDMSSLYADISGPGQIDLPDDSSGGFGNHLTDTYGSGPGTFTVDARLSAGHIDVRTP